MNHKITVSAFAEGRYRVTGAVAIEDTARPVQDAALALKAAGADDSDTLHATGCEIPTFVAMTLGAILKPRSAPMRSEVGRILRAQSRF